VSGSVSSLPQGQKVGYPAPERALRTSRSRCPSCSTVLLWVFAVWFVYSFYELYVALSPELCDLSKETASTDRQARCILPLFAKDQALDIYIFASASPSLLDSPHAASKSLKPFWNVTNMSTSAASTFGGTRGTLAGVWRAGVPVPASVATTNGSYFAHIAIVRHGGSPYLADHTPVRVAGGGVAFEDLVLYSSELTCHMKAARRHNVRIGCVVSGIARRWDFFFGQRSQV
jgi:hypothetical protein